MRRIAWLLTAITIIAFSCNKGNKGELIVKGTIENANNNKIYLTKVDGQQQNKLDSAKIGDDGSFQMSADIENARYLYMGQIKKQNYIQLIGKPGDEITIKGNMKDLGANYTVEGSEESENVRYLSDLLMETRSSIDSLRGSFEEEKASLKDQATASDKMRENQQLVQNRADEYYEKKIAFVKDHLGDLSSIVGLSGLQIDEYFEYYKKVDSALMEKYPDNPEVKSFHQYVENRSKEVEARKKAGEKLTKGKKAPDFTLKTPNKEPLSLSDVEGEYILLDFWASWCQPCRKENPNLVANYKKFKNQGFNILQVSVDRDRDAWLQAIKKDRLGSWQHVYDANSKVAEMYNVQAIPTSYLLNGEGIIVDKNLRGEQIEQKLKQLFK